MRARLVWIAATWTLLALAGCLRDSGGIDRAPVDTPKCPVDDLQWSERVVVGNRAGGGPAGGTSSQPWTFEVPSEAGWNARDGDCVRAIRVDATWTNGPTGGADLFVGVIVPGTDQEILGHDEQQYAMDGRHTESVFAPTALEGYSGAALLEGLSVSLHTRWASLADGGLPVDVTVTLVVP